MGEFVELIKWGGGEIRPVTPDTRVTVVLRNGNKEENLAACFDWRHFGESVADGDSDILAYSVKES